MSRQGLLCRNRGFYVVTGLAGQAHDLAWAHAIGLRARLERPHYGDSRPLVATEISCPYKVWDWDWVARVTTEGFSVMTELFWFRVATVDDVAIGCDQGREALCCDTTIVL